MSGTITTFRNALTRFQGFTHDGARDLYKIFGYKQELESLDFYRIYERFGIANRAVSAFPQATWRNEPLIGDEDGTTPEESAFVKSTQEFMERTSAFHFLERADRLSGVGSYSILLLGFNDGNDLSEPLPLGNHELLYMKPYFDFNAEITDLVTDVNDPRFGLPLIYTIDQNEETQGRKHKRKHLKASVESFKVHHSRVIHIAEFLDQDDIYGTPRLQPVFNDLVDLQKVAGAAPELFWLNGRGGLGLFADKEAQLSDTEKEAIKTQGKSYIHELGRLITGSGMTANPIQFNVPDPRSTADVKLDLIAGGLGIPKRILLGSERGDLSSTQDENNFNERTQERQTTFAVPNILKPFITKMIETGNIQEPKGECQIFWDNTVQLTEQEQADINLKKTQSLTTYANSPSAEIYVPSTEFREKFLGLPPESEFEDTMVDDFEETEEEREIFENLKAVK